MFSQNSWLKLLSIVFFTLFLSACGGSDSTTSGKTLLTCDVPMVPDVTGSSCVAPEPIQCPAPTVPDALNESCVVGVDPSAPTPVFFPADNQAVLYYNRADGVYDEYKMHNWNDANCNAYAEDSLAPSWDNGLAHTGVDPNYGAYWVVNLVDDFNECGNFIIHKGTDDAGKEFGGGDWKMPLKQEDDTYQRMNFTFSGVASIFEYPIVTLGEQPLQIADFSAHWIDSNTFVWNAIEDVVEVKLHHSASAGIEADENDQVNGTAVGLSATTLTDEQKAIAPLVADWPAFSGDWSRDDAKAMLKEQQVLVGYNAEGKAIAATFVQNANVLDDLYTQGDDDADEAKLGVSYQNGAIDLALWAPTAQSVTVNIFDTDKNKISSAAMTENATSGVWSYQGDASLDRMFYQFELSVYHYQSKAIETLVTTDPYSVGLSTNGDYSQFVNLGDSDLMPDGWEGHEVATIENYEDAVIYEGHIRDFSAMDESTSEENRGKFLAFTETNSLPVQHLQKLVDNGLTHFHMLPVNDIASINEDTANIVDLDNTVAELCAIKTEAPVCGVNDDNATLRSVLESYSSYSNDAANLMNVLREVDSFNWGYDPKHFNVPDGIYASNPDGVARITEMRAMIKALHDLGLRVILDVVYNHTNSAGLWDHSVFDKIVPGYYYSRNIETGAVIQSTCCNDTALEHRMMDKFMVDSLSSWTQYYQFDGFRFDIMSHGSKAQMLAAREAVQAIDSDTHFYGEGWNRDDRGFEQANQFNMAGSEIATFNDRLRDGVRSGQLFSNNANEDGPFIQQDIIKLGLAGSLADYVLKNFNGTDTAGSAFSPNMYAKDPADVINYVSKHDNETLWDQLQFNLDYSMDMNDRVRAQNVSQSIVLLSQGIPFLQMGGDFLRSKSLDRNTYDAGDWFNFVDFTYNTNNWNMGLPLDKGGRSDDDLVSLAASPYMSVGMSEISFASNVFNEFLKIRSTSPLFKLTTSADIIARVGFHNIGKRQTQGLIVMSIDDGAGLTDLDPMNDAIVVVINGSNTELSHTVSTAEGFTLHDIQQTSFDSTVTSASFNQGDGEGTFTVPALTTAVFVKVQGESQGVGLSAFATAGAPDVVPYGDTSVYVRGGMNGWGEVDAFSYVGDGIYRVAIDLTANEYEFKLASGDWSTVNLGAPQSGNVVEEGVDFTLLPGSNDNLKLSIATDATYIFTLDASNTSAPILTVSNEEPFVGTTVFIRGGMNGWGEGNPFTYIGDGKYSTTINIDANTHEFKVASGDWSTVNMGAPSDDKEVFAGEEQLLVAGSNDNLTMTFATSGDYTFIFDASDLNEPTLTVYSAQMFGDTSVYIRGDMNGWGEVNVVTYQGNSSYAAEIDLAQGSYGFKVASGDWSTFNLGAGAQGSEVTLDQPLTLAQGSNDNLSFVADEAATYIFTVTGPNPDSPTVTVSKK
ncbi:alpha-1,6-glucosidase domain-containing protein [Colwelliaceae bacterium 6471]